MWNFFFEPIYNRIQCWVIALTCAFAGIVAGDGIRALLLH